MQVPEPPQGKHAITWIASHLSHEYNPGADKGHEHWHRTGPVIRLMNWR
jgi:hypothetical protein